jgi:hypothetical protein
VVGDGVETVQMPEAEVMRGARYNSGIPHCIASTVNRRSHAGFRLAQILIAIFVVTSVARAADWSAPEQQLARKIVNVTGPGAVAMSVENRSSLGRRDGEIIENGLRSALAAMGIRFVPEDQAAATVTITLSENVTSYVWVAQIRQGATESAVVMVSVPRAEDSIATGDSVPLTLRKIPLWAQDARILDVAVLEESAFPTHIAVLDPENVSLYRLLDGKWQAEQQLAITHAKPWPRDLRGRLIPARDHLFDAYLPGVFCSSSTATPLALNCHASDDPWPLAGGTPNATIATFPGTGLSNGSPANGAATAVPQMKAFFAPTRNFFTGVLTPSLGTLTNIPKFYSAAFLPRDKYILWLFATTDGQVHMVDGVSDQVTRPAWGSDLTSVKTACGAGWQVLAVSAGSTAEDSIRAYEFPDRDPVAVSEAVDLPGTLTALWREAKGEAAIAVVWNRESGSYEAFRLAVACNQ